MSPKAPVRFARAVPDGDTHEREVCERCSFVHYQNPKVVVGSVIRHDGKILMCRRAIEPRAGFWTVPAGYLELHETAEAGARREAYEEACADLQIDSLLAVYSIVHLSQIQLIYRARLKSASFAAGEESLEVGLFGWDEIPWSDIAFPSVHWMLGHERQVQKGSTAMPFANPETP
jgi:ADP-ribose pyrophosphatase YjhB (NUDIX family)